MKHTKYYSITIEKLHIYLQFVEQIQDTSILADDICYDMLDP